MGLRVLFSFCQGISMVATRVHSLVSNNTAKVAHEYATYARYLLVPVSPEPPSMPLSRFDS